MDTRLKLILLAFHFIFIFTLSAQQINQISMPIFNPYFHHAAYAGFDRSISTTLMTRNQWNGLEGSPVVRYLGAHLPVFVWKAGIGTDLYSIQEGNINYRNFRLSANKIFEIFNGVLSSSVRVGVHSINIDGSKIRTPEGNYTNGSIFHNDDILQTTKFSGLGLGWELSTWYRWSKFQAGLSLAQTPSNKVNIEKSSLTMKENLNFYFQTFFDIMENIQIQPNISLFTDFNQLQTEISGVARINGNVFGGITLRGYSTSSLDALGFMLGHKLNKRYSVYYNYDAGISPLRRTNEGSHEIILRVNFYNLPGTGLPPKIIYNPRFLE